MGTSNLLGLVGSPGDKLGLSLVSEGWDWARHLWDRTLSLGRSCQN